MKTYHYIVKGRVQGVAFRYYTRMVAERLGVNGTVKNLWNGDVEVYAQGEPDFILKFEKFLRSGPSSARVEQLVKEEKEYNQIYRSFEVIF